MTPLTCIRCVIILVLFQACSTPGMPGHISQSASKFDGTQELRLEPAWLYDSPIKLGLLWTSNMKGDELVLQAVVKGAHQISSAESLHFNVDGKIVSFDSLDSSKEFETSSGDLYNNVYIPGSSWSMKQYLVKERFIDEILDAKRVAVKIDLGSSYAEGIFSSDGPMTARPAFRGFKKNLSQARTSAR